MAKDSGTASGGEPVGELLSQLGHQMGELVAKEMQLARAELRDGLAKGVKATASLSGAGCCTRRPGVPVVGRGLGPGRNNGLGWAFLIVGAVQLAVAGALFLTGSRQAAAIDPVPHQTLETLKEDARWAKNQTS